mmetsp:Transcript_8083/g.8231  ORF Transcript_8083/g.8231 Transcript_8083/m.8231 type:complete len:152 (+) Transcript_8083:136-591(+)
MPVHSVIITSIDGNLLFSKYFDRKLLSSKEETQKFERMIFIQTEKYWDKQTGLQCITMMGDIHVIFQMIGELRLFLCGIDDTDELILQELLTTVLSLLEEHLENRFTQTSLLVPDNYGKLCVSLDDMLPDGIVETLDVDTIMKMSKLKPFI